MKDGKHVCNFVPLFAESFNPARAWWYYRLGYPLYVICPDCHAIAKIIVNGNERIYQILTEKQTIRHLSDQASAWNSYTVHNEYRMSSKQPSKAKVSR